MFAFAHSPIGCPAHTSTKRVPLFTLHPYHTCHHLLQGNIISVAKPRLPDPSAPHTSNPVRKKGNTTHSPSGSAAFFLPLAPHRPLRTTKISRALPQRLARGEALWCLTSLLESEVCRPKIFPPEDIAGLAASSPYYSRVQEGVVVGRRPFVAHCTGTDYCVGALVPSQACVRCS